MFFNRKVYKVRVHDDVVRRPERGVVLEEQRGGRRLDVLDLRLVGAFLFLLPILLIPARRASAVSILSGSVSFDVGFSVSAWTTERARGKVRRRAGTHTLASFGFRIRFTSANFFAFALFFPITRWSPDVGTLSSIDFRTHDERRRRFPRSRARSRERGRANPRSLHAVVTPRLRRVDANGVHGPRERRARLFVRLWHGGGSVT